MDFHERLYIPRDTESPEIDTGVPFKTAPAFAKVWSVKARDAVGAASHAAAAKSVRPRPQRKSVGVFASIPNIKWSPSFTIRYTFCYGNFYIQTKL